MTEHTTHRVSIFNSQGEKVRTFGTHGSGPGKFRNPKGVAVDKDGNILVADCDNHHVQKFSPDGKLIKSVGMDHCSSMDLLILATISHDGRILVGDYGNHRIQILHSNLTFHSSFGSHGDGNGQFHCTSGVITDSKGSVVVSDWKNHHIQVVTEDGHFLRKFGKEGRGDGELFKHAGITIDSDDMVIC